jgi:hypothetical protein
MVCTNNTCVVSCNLGDEPTNDTLCGGVNAALTCSESAGHLCVLACGNGGTCPSGYSCLDPGNENACLPDGTFPGSTCRADVGNECDEDLGGNAAVDMVCSDNTCVVSCNLGDETMNDLLCGAVNIALTCSQSADHVCVVKCGNGGLCPEGFSCLNAGTEDACLPDGTFPGSSCRTTQGDECDMDFLATADLQCLGGTCLVACPGDNDTPCDAVNSALTCYGTFNVCLLECGPSDSCPQGYMCDTGEDACVPIL